MTAEWVDVIAGAEVTTAPRGVVVDGHHLVVVRLTEDGPPVAFGGRCPHRLVPLAAGDVVGGRLRCAYHGWEFGADGSCLEIPSLGPAATAPPRAALAAARCREEAGRVRVLAADLAALPAQPAAAAPDGGGPGVLTNEDPALARAWHPVAFATELGSAAEPSRVTLLGREWTVWRDVAELRADPVPYGLTVRWGLVWLAPAEPLVPLFTEPDVEDAAFVGAWLRPAATPAPAGFVADNFLDVAHFPFVHAGTFGAGEEKIVEPYEVVAEPDGFRSTQVQWFDNPEDPGVAAGLRPLRQRRRATYVYRAPFQLLLRLEELDAGAVKTILFVMRPESLTSTVVYTKMLLRDIGGVALPGGAVVASEVAYEERVVGEDLALQAQLGLTGLPLVLRDELHVRADRLGVALRRALAAFVESAQR
ncbi:Rieske 2Fe-2S domain-containing protein [Luedemannella helvata]|uniref:Rieske domain-containing protein n=1 Tax=Luedemannella helvata TaxID=349315 RepID=A0ABP4WS49_9ACTN